MSSIPKPKVIRKPKSLSSDGELDTVQHQLLLDWLWTNLDRLIPLWISIKSEIVEERTNEAIKAYDDQVEETLKAYRRCSEIADDHEHVPALKLAIKRIEKHLAAFRLAPPSLPADANVTTVTSKHYQQVISVRKYDRSGDWRDETVGYIDLEAHLSMFKSCRLEGCPVERVNLMHEVLHKPSAAEYIQQHVRSASWDVSREEQRVWFDVRSALPPTGVLIRELRVLQELAGSGVIIALVAADIPEVLHALLRHEGFWTVSQAELSERLSNES